ADVVVAQDSLMVMVFSQDGMFRLARFLPDTLEDIRDLVYGSDGSLYVGARRYDGNGRLFDSVLKLEKGRGNDVLWSRGGFVNPRAIPGDGLLVLRSAHHDSMSEVEYVM